ncbi:unnamed protein product [Linum tenue]|uniref:Glucosidase 2 subunit beta n=1 Tax=Linum tenue TaxID=586396 RepID=A0AAV0HJI2_9ROSI|nr:unnamed protein product [Linum tenue]
MKVAFFLSIAILSLLASWSSSSPSVSFLGIAPQDENYFRKETIKCRNGSRKFTKAQLNDDFCDCLDGTDEPGTSACPEGKFYCRNVGHLPTSLYSSMVNDGICDCCDGSDEYDGKVKCRNTCWEAGKKARDKLQKLIDMYREGVTIRKREVEQAKEAISKDKAELSVLKAEEKSLDKLVNQLKVRKEQIEKAEGKEQLEKDNEDRSNADVEENFETTEASGKEDSLTSEDDVIGLVEQDGSESIEDMSKEEIGRLVASRWTGERTGQVEETGSGDSKTNAYDHHQSSITDDLDSSSVVHEPGLDKQTQFLGQERASCFTIHIQSWLRKMQDVSQNLLRSVSWFSSPLDNLDADKIREEYKESTARLSSAQERISSLTEKLKHDLGVDGEFYTLYGQCFETKQDKYVYKICPFKEAVQEEGQYHKTQLGYWEKFEESYSAMLFSNGAGCWNGPRRSIKVKLRCGLKTELTDVDEPSRCEYLAVLSTPLGCLDGKLKVIVHKHQRSSLLLLTLHCLTGKWGSQQELEGKLEMLQKEKPEGHDEL